MRHRIAAFGIGRRSLSCAVLGDRSLEHIEIHHIPEPLALATESLRNFVRWSVETFQPDLCVVLMADDPSERIQELHAALDIMIGERALPIWKINSETLLQSFAIPELRTKKELESIGWSFWPFIDQHQHTPALLPALAGVYVWAERLLGN